MYLQPTALQNESLVPDYSSNPFISGYELTITGDTTFTLNPGTARAYNSGFVITYNPFLSPGLPQKLNLDLNTLGPLGCFPYSIANVALTDATSLNVYVIANTSGNENIVTTAIVATGNNFLPPGYNAWRKVGTVYLNGRRILAQLTQSGSGIDRQYTLQNIIAGAIYGPTNFFPLIVSAGAGPCNPNFTTNVLLERLLIPNSINDTAATTTFPAGLDLPYFLTSPGAGGGSSLTDQVTVPTSIDINGNAAVYISLVGASARFQVSVFGWIESMGLQAI